MINTSAPLAASFGDFASFAPAATNSSARDAVRFHTVTACPAFNKFIAIGRPISPSPMNPILRLCSGIRIHDASSAIFSGPIVADEAGTKRTFAKIANVQNRKILATSNCLWDQKLQFSGVRFRGANGTGVAPGVKTVSGFPGSSSRTIY